MNPGDLHTLPGDGSLGKTIDLPILGETPIFGGVLRSMDDSFILAKADNGEIRLSLLYEGLYYKIRLILSYWEMWDESGENDEDYDPGKGYWHDHTDILRCELYPVATWYSFGAHELDVSAPYPDWRTALTSWMDYRDLSKVGRADIRYMSRF